MASTTPEHNVIDLEEVNSSGTPPGQARASTSKPTSVPKKPLPLAASNLQAETNLDLSTEDTEMIGLGAEDSENSENIDPNVQAEKKPLLSMEVWICAYCDEKNRSYQYFCSTCMSLKPEGSNSKSAHKSQVRKRTLSDKEQPPVKKSNVTSMASTTSEHSVIDLEEVNSSTSVENPAESVVNGVEGKNCVLSQILF